jgi:tRNA wybutosine-synthesizing protein 2
MVIDPGVILYKNVAMIGHYMVLTPYQMVQQDLSRKIPSNLLKNLPRKWEKIGDVLVIKLTSSYEPYVSLIGESYARYLDCEAVLLDTGGITGQYREPMIHHIYGKNNTETLHHENGIKYYLDPQKIMFSSGNMDERIRMGSISNPTETVVDLFTGIGYFTIPIAVYSKPKRIIACEINPTAYQYLEKNIKANNVDDIVEPRLGDSQDIAPKDTADRVIMGYIQKTRAFLPTAIESLRNHCGIIHYHDTFPDRSVPQTPVDMIQLYCTRYKRTAHLMYYHRIKSYAPGISHYVFDIDVREEHR